MRVKREYLTSELPAPHVIERVVEKIVPRTIEKVITDPIVIKRLAQIEKVVNEILAHELEPEPEDPGPTASDIMARLDALAQKVERIAAAPPPAPAAPPKQAYQFDVVRNSAGGIERIMAKPVTSKSIYGGH